ncbi:hypothetical protein E5288_WYG001773 [Bos mutus]|uniref:Uncharacterized protein n=1 Tax=Bos mutus TaxID=72004 RepID=A0A6B0RNW4_9CETA|nr:hypothetical protein [Bos mutus]
MCPCFNSSDLRFTNVAYRVTDIQLRLVHRQAVITLVGVQTRSLENLLIFYEYSSLGFFIVTLKGFQETAVLIPNPIAFQGLTRPSDNTKYGIVIFKNKDLDQTGGFFAPGEIGLLALTTPTIDMHQPWAIDLKTWVMWVCAFATIQAWVIHRQRTEVEIEDGISRMEGTPCHHLIEHIQCFQVICYGIHDLEHCHDFLFGFIVKNNFRWTSATKIKGPDSIPWSIHETADRHAAQFVNILVRTKQISVPLVPNQGNHAKR